MPTELRSPPNTCLTGSPSPSTSPPPAKASSLQLFQMGWFGSSTPEPTAVTRGGRQHCWDNRDAYFGCLDNSHVLKPGDEGKACATEKAAYEKSCAKSWIDYFNKRRVLAEQQKGVLQQMKNQSDSS